MKPCFDGDESFMDLLGRLLGLFFASPGDGETAGEGLAVAEAPVEAFAAALAASAVMAALPLSPARKPVGHIFRKTMR